MTPAQKKAKELVDKFTIDLKPFSELGHWDISQGKQCALIAIDEKLEVLDKIRFVINCIDLRDEYLEVKNEIEKI